LEEGSASLMSGGRVQESALVNGADANPSDATVDAESERPLASDFTPAAENTQGPDAEQSQTPPVGQMYEILLDDVEQTNREADSSIDRLAAFAEDLDRRRSSTERWMIEAARAAERNRSTLERMAIRAGSSKKPCYD
jgi:hypothetical protein